MEQDEFWRSHLDGFLRQRGSQRVKRRAIVASLVTTAKLDGIEPFAWLREVLTAMVAGYPANHLDDLLPRRPEWVAICA